jgi:hypothetical protein
MLLLVVVHALRRKGVDWTNDSRSIVHGVWARAAHVRRS